MIIGSIWINDTMAYLVGSIIGRTSVVSHLSQKDMGRYHRRDHPGHRCHGLIGYWLNNEPAWALFAPIHWMAVAAIVSVTGTFGDLLESKLKRMAGIKDSGRIMPGHGGFLDRFDSLLVATPFAFAYLLWVIYG
jgi:phosphatidate cytidylyltransferase